MRTREVFRQWGVVDRFLAARTLLTELRIHSSASRLLGAIDFSILDAEAESPGLLILEQSRTEKLLLEAVRETGLCDIRFSHDATALVQDEDGVRIVCRDRHGEQVIEARFAVGCDGAGSFTRNALGVSFDGLTYAVRPMLADVRITDTRDALPWPRIWNGAGGLSAAIRLEPGLWRLIRLERGAPDADDDVAVEEIDEHVRRTLGPGPFTTEWANRFRIHLRSAPTFRVGRVLLAGDAAHIHSPAGGLGMNAGIQDAHNLAWRLAGILRGSDADRHLAAYDRERRSVTVKAVSNYADYATRIFLQSPSFLRACAFGMMLLLLAIAPLRKAILRRLSMIGLRYGSQADRCVGLRLPDPLLRRADGMDERLYALLPTTDPALLRISEDNAIEPASLPLPVVRIGRGFYQDPSCQLRKLLGRNEGWILIRPDRHIAWAGSDWQELHDAARHIAGRSMLRRSHG